MKRPWLMAAWPLLLLFYSSSTLTAVVDSNKNKNNDARLKVSIRKDTMLGVPSCQHTFSQIELLNMVRYLSSLWWHRRRTSLRHLPCFQSCIVCHYPAVLTMIHICHSQRERMPRLHYWETVSEIIYSIPQIQLLFIPSRRSQKRPSWCDRNHHQHRRRHQINRENQRMEHHGVVTKSHNSSTFQNFLRRVFHWVQVKWRLCQ